MAIFTNQATLTYNGNIRSSNITTGEILDVLTVTKNTLADEYSLNDNITYIVSIVNSGCSAFTGLTVTDDLGTYAFGSMMLTPLTYVPGSVRLFLNGVLQPTPAVNPEPPLKFSGICVPAGGNVIIIYDATVNSYAPLGMNDAIRNTVTVTGCGLANPITAQATVAAVEGPELFITKSLTPLMVPGNGRLTYTFVIENFGNTAATVADNAVITDDFQPVLGDITVKYNGTVWTQGVQYTYNASTGAFATLPGRITVPAAGFTQDPATGVWRLTPGVSVLSVTGNI